MELYAVPPEVRSLLARFVEERTGLHYPAGQEELLLGKIAPRAAEAGFDSLLDYYYFLRYDDRGAEELDELVESLVVTETYLFRELDGLRVLAEEVLAPLVARGGRPRVWCAAAASGEEPLTLAMLLAARGVLDRVRIVASDLSRRAIERGRRGRLGPRSLRRAPPADVAPWLRADRDGVAVAPELVAAVEWRRLNLIDRQAILDVGPCDAIVCRNVLIYFRDDTARRIVATMAALLRDDGVLLVGASESLLRLGTSLRWESRRGVFFYRKAR